MYRRSLPHARLLATSRACARIVSRRLNEFFERLDALRDRAFIGEIAALVVAVILASGGVAVLAVSLNTSSKLFAQANDFHHRSDFVAQLRADAHHAMAITIPATDVNGAANADGHEIAFYTRDSGHNPFFWSYNYDAAAKTVQRYDYDNPGTHQNLRAIGPAVGSFTTFAAAYESANASATSGTNPLLAAAGVTNIAPQNLGYPGIDSSNRLVTLSLTTLDANTSVKLLPDIGPSGFTMVVGSYWKLGPLNVTPAQIGMAGGSSTCYYPDNSAHSPCAIALTEDYYTGQFIINPNNCIGIATENTNALTGTGNSAVGFDIGSGAPGNCQLLILDDHGGNIPVQVTIWGPLQVNPVRFDFHSPGDSSPQAWNASGASVGADPNGTINASEAYYVGGYAISDGDTSGANGCGGAISASQSGSSFSLRANSTVDACNLTIRDGHGGSQVISVHVGGSLVVSPGSLSFADGSSPAQNFSAHESAYTGPFNVTDNCGGSFSTALVSGGGNGNDSSYSAKPNSSNKSCTVTVTDNRGNSGTVALASSGASATPSASALIVTPNVLHFANGSAPSQNFSASEAGYSGPFNVTDSCAGAFTYVATSGGSAGPASTYSVTPHVSNRTCVGTVTDTGGQTGTVTLSSLGSLSPINVCDPQSPARPVGTDIGPDVDGIHEDFSNGTTCVGPSPSPSPIVTPTPVITPVPTPTPAPPSARSVFAQPVMQTYGVNGSFTQSDGTLTCCYAVGEVQYYATRDAVSDNAGNVIWTGSTISDTHVQACSTQFSGAQGAPIAIGSFDNMFGLCNPTYSPPSPWGYTITSWSYQISNEYWTEMSPGAQAITVLILGPPPPAPTPQPPVDCAVYASDPSCPPPKYS